MEDIHVRVWHSNDGSYRLEAFIIPPVTDREHWAWVLLLIEGESSKRVAWGHGGHVDDAIDCVTAAVKRFDRFDGDLHAVRWTVDATKR